MSLPNIMLIGYGRAGKGTFCRLAKDYGLYAASSSQMACELGQFDPLADKHGYSSGRDFYPDRHIDRDGCYQAICDYVKGDLPRLGRKIYEGRNIYDGCRDDKELIAIRDEGLFDVSIWIDGGDRIPPEPITSMTVTREHADMIIDNHTDEATYIRRVHNVLRMLTR
jgi:hypothetical protein